MKEYDVNKIEASARAVTEELVSAAGIGKNSILVVWCSSSEIAGDIIGHGSSPEEAEAVFRGIFSVTCKNEIFIAAQCCEHLNRALIIERDAIQYVKNASIVNVVPQPKAGGAFAAYAYNCLKDPVALEQIEADAGIDIGSTLIGMHLRAVAVPVRLKIREIGCAAVTAARVRPKFIGGSRAIYDERLI